MDFDKHSDVKGPDDIIVGISVFIEFTSCLMTLIKGFDNILSVTY